MNWLTFSCPPDGQSARLVASHLEGGAMHESYACPTCHTPFFTVENADTDVPSVRIASKVSLGFGGRGYCTAVCGGCGAATPLVLSRLIEAEVESVWRRMQR
jgi:hypothetical protein